MYTMKPVIYAIQNPLGEKYIGSSVNVANRRHNHRRNLRKGRGVNRLLQASWDTHGGAAHTFSVVASVLDPTQMHLVEKQVMDGLGAELNVNLDPTPVHIGPAGKIRTPPKVRTSPEQVAFGPHPTVRGFGRAMGLTHKAAKYYARTYSYEATLYKLAFNAGYVTPPVIFGPPDPRKHPALVNLGSGWDSRKALKTEHGVTDRAYTNRITAGWSVKDALTTQLGAAPKKPMPKRTGSRASVCRKYGVATHLYTSRRANNWTVAQALNLAPHPPLKGRPPVKKRYLTAAGQTRSMDDWAAQSGFSKSNIYSRLTAGCTPEQAVGLEKTERELRSEANAAKASEKPKRPTYTLGGVTGNISELAAHFGVPYDQLNSRKRMGWPESEWLKPAVKYKQPRAPMEKAPKPLRVSRPPVDKAARAAREKSMRDEFAELLKEYDHH